MPGGLGRLRRIGLIGSGLATAVLAGFLLGSCGGGDGSAVTTLTGVTATRPAATATRPSLTVPTRTAPTAPTPTEPATTAESPPETTAPETTAPEPATTAPPPTVTVTETTETTAPVPTEPATTEAPPTTTAEAAETTASEEDSTPWGWIALGIALAAAVLIGLLLWRRRKAGAETWAAQTSDLSRRTLVALDDVIRDGSVVTGRIQALAAEARSLESHAPDDAAGQPQHSCAAVSTSSRQRSRPTEPFV